MTISALKTSHRKYASLILFTLLSLNARAALAQSTATPDVGDQGPERGHEWEIWTGAGGDPIGTPKITLGNGLWTAGARYGWILTDAHGPGVLRGRFEYAVDAVPVLVVFQPGGAAYGIGVNPWIMKWNFVARGRVSPYIEIGGGLVFTTRQVPLGANKFNFSPTGADRREPSAGEIPLERRVPLFTHLRRTDYRVQSRHRYIRISCWLRQVHPREVRQEKQLTWRGMEGLQRPGKRPLNVQ